MQKIPKDILAFVISMLEFLLLGRFLLKLLGASTASPAVSWIYETSEPLLRPFALAFPASAAQRTGILEYNTLFALFVYAFIGYAAEALLNLLLNSATSVHTPASEKVVYAEDDDIEVNEDDVEPEEKVTKTRVTHHRR